MRLKLLERCSYINFYRTIFYLLGCVLISFGVVLSIVSNFGTGAWDAVNTGLFNRFGYSIGLWVNVNAIVLVLLSGLILKKIPRVTTLITSFICGFFIDIFINLLSNIQNNTMASSFLICMSGIVIMSLGVALYLVTDFPPSPVDYFMMCIKDRFNLSIRLAKTIEEGIGIAIALFLKGPIGFGTILMLILVGPIIQFLFKYTSYLFDKLTLKNKQSEEIDENIVIQSKTGQE